MRSWRWLFLAIVLTGCAKNESSPAAIELPEAPAFANWPTASEGRYMVGPVRSMICRSDPPEKEAQDASERKDNGPHAAHSIVVRVNPDAIDTFRAGKPLPAGTVVVKEKYAHVLNIFGDDEQIAKEEAEQELNEYALMIKREPGYFPEGGDWEYAYITLGPERKVSRGRLAECADCHGSGNTREHLFRSYLKESATH